MKLSLTRVLSLLLLLWMAPACSLPLAPMTPAERKADMAWAFSLFKHNYAPLDLKAQNFGLHFEELEETCIEEAQEEMSNQEFLALFHRCIRSFQDAHVGAQQMNAGLLPEYAEVAHLGFLTMRTKFEGENVLRIVEALKGADNSGAPLVVGDLILKVNGKSVANYLNAEVVPYVTVGQKETNLSLAALRFPVRTSVDMALPNEEDIELEILRGANRFSITLPWIREDMLDFQIRQNPIENDESLAEDELKDKLKEELEDLFNSRIATSVENALSQTLFGYKELRGLFDLLGNPADVVINRLHHMLHQSFRAARFNPVLNSLVENHFTDSPLSSSGLRSRIFPKAAKIEDLMSNPMFKAKVITTGEGDTYAYIQLASFPAEDKVLAEWHRAITAIEDKEIDQVVIDLIDNGGGSLVHGLRILNMLRVRSLEYPSLKLRLNNNWLTAFKTQAAFGKDDYSKAIARRVVRDLEEDQRQGRRLSRPVSATVMDPFFLQNPSIGLSEKVRLAVLVNEFCVSMCDVFASMVQENNLGVVIGQRTMGGGGNVTQHGLSPISKMGVALTESLVLTAKGKVIEDQGVEPDIFVDMVADREHGFEGALKAALEAFAESQKDGVDSLVQKD